MTGDMKSSHAHALQYIEDLIKNGTPDDAGWIKINRDQMASDSGLSRVHLARLLSKAEKKLGIIVESGRIRAKYRREKFQDDNKVDVSAIIEFAKKFMDEIDRKESNRSR